MVKHPGEVLKVEFFEPEKISQTQLAIRLAVPQSRIQKILAGERGISPDMAIRLGEYYKNGPEYWLNIQVGYELAKLVESGRAAAIKKEIRGHV